MCYTKTVQHLLNFKNIKLKITNSSFIKLKLYNLIYSTATKNLKIFSIN